MEGISQAGATPIIFPFSNDEEELSQLVDMCDWTYVNTLDTKAEPFNYKYNYGGNEL